MVVRCAGLYIKMFFVRAVNGALQNFTVPAHRRPLYSDLLLIEKHLVWTNALRINLRHMLNNRRLNCKLTWWHEIGTMHRLLKSLLMGGFKDLCWTNCVERNECGARWTVMAEQLPGWGNTHHQLWALIGWGLQLCSDTLPLHHECLTPSGCDILFSIP